MVIIKSSVQIIARQQLVASYKTSNYNMELLIYFYIFTLILDILVFGFNYKIILMNYIKLYIQKKLNGKIFFDEL